MYCLRESGGADSFRMQKRLDYYPSAVAKYRRPGPDSAGVCFAPFYLPCAFTVVCCFAVLLPCACLWQWMAITDADVCHNLMIASHTANLNVYKETTLIWAARNHMQPIAMDVGKFGCVHIPVCSLDHVNGELSV